MTYTGIKIEEPTLSMFVEHIERRHLAADPEFCYNYFKKRKWRNKKGRRIRSVEIMIGALNSLFIHKEDCKQSSHKEKTNDWMAYDEQLQDKRWMAFRRFIFDVRGKKCEKCGSTTYLQVHHPKYKHGRMAWEYTCNDVIVLCRDCHAKIHNKQTDING